MQKVHLLREDYEQYQFSLPVNKILGKKRKQYITAELEQRHPCFSDDFGFDSILKLTRKGLLSDVVVIDKRKLSEYRAKYGLWNPGFFIDESKRICFMPSFLRNTLWVILICLSLLLCILGINQLRQKEKLRVINEKKFQTDIKLEKLDLSEPEIIFPAGELCRIFFDKVQESHGKILTFNWEIQGYIEKLKVSLTDLYPDDLVDGFLENEISSLVYRNGKPFFDFGIHQKIGIIGRKQTSDSSSVLHNEIRTILNTNKIQIIEETYKPFVFKFVINDDFSLFSEIEKLLKKYDAGVSCVSITESSKQFFLVELHILEDFCYTDGLPVGLISVAQSIFPDRKKKEVKKEIVRNEAKNKENNSLKKVGEVKYEDGKSIIFYLNKDGKLIKSLEGE